jgi:acetyl esterase/lipase
MLSPWLDLTRAISGKSPNQPTDWLTTFDEDGTQRDCIDVYCGSLIKSASDPRVSPLWRKPSSRLPKQFLSAGQAEVLFADAKLWADKCRRELGDEAIECHFAEGQVHTFAIGGWLADAGVESISDQRLLTFVKRHVEQ